MAQRGIGFIGAGQMATALAQGMLQARLAQPAEIVASDPEPAARERFAKTTGARITEDNVEVLRAADTIFLAVKPQVLSAVLEPLTSHFAANHLLVSIAAGIPLTTIVRHSGSARLVRVMPNTPCLVGHGASAYSLGAHATADDAARVAELLSAVGRAYQVEEKLLDAVTGLSGSGPAFVCLVLEALSDGGVRMGLPRKLATDLAAQTLLGTAAMVLQTGEHPAMLKDRVTSPGGTTIAGLQALEDGGVRGAMIAAVEAATRRARELGQSG